MSEFIDYLNNTVPWFLPTLLWILGALVVFAILMIPAYYIFHPFFEMIRKKLEAFVLRLIERLKEVRREREVHLDRFADEFLKDGGLRRLNSESEGHLSALTKQLGGTLKKLHKSVAKMAQSLTKLISQLLKFQKQIEKSELDIADTLPALAEQKKPANSEGTRRVAWMKLILAGIVLLALMLVNTGMLSQILTDLGVVPATMTFLGIALASVFAFILTLVEAGLGIAHGATRDNETQKLSLWPSMMLLFAIVLACVEGFFYSRVAPGTGTFTLPFIGYTMPQNNLFFLWGFILVLTLFSLSSIGFDACVTILRGGAIRKLTKIYERYAHAHASSRTALGEARTLAKNIDEVVAGPAANAESVRQQLDLLLEELKKLKGETPEWAKGKEEGLTRTEVYQLAEKGGLWLTVAIVGIVTVTITGLHSFASFYPTLERPILWVLAVGQSVVFLGIGFLLGVDETIVQGGRDQRKVLVSPHFPQLAARFIGGSLVLTYLVLFFTHALPISMGAVWVLNLLVGLLLIAAGYQLSPLLNVVRLWVMQVWSLLMHALEGLWVMLTRLFTFMIMLLENIFYLLALPLERYLRARRERKGLTSAQ